MANGNTVVIGHKIANRKTITKPSYGSDEWWDEEIKRGEADVKSGNYKSFKSARSLIADLHK
ncbi:hypothetical protein A3D00_02950 [Candidatus Woesebacteria bacterium RIFCSPHIGHO2_02_FULL_38_9]|uniref:Uncharacterized protein n=1 Tax=Candidatus Woesebacteria bacterium RIFCSPHIGHO2_01_FULL_39_28 TaxID=1802496 RepID=A0A1F7YFQ9_9BACT|nr:MAG: hypothetical protein A2627_03905 [Candidatus Woesebacteria bacterium RIFCSPHIGHO2_01_FULL_39_28]OGM35341.1 MAG: hypothetical protein A3D00_02950 [Candidatus Woesebacteria bacterium RIFCSPHIGHO2_02_FULL_38_9]OGM57237.1 MAG: hypothetical protein A3A50_00465 [Candidatus Woesebacteria bacterium RIFCSPLOWO2_01_FULL_38_20]